MDGKRLISADDLAELAVQDLTNLYMRENGRPSKKMKAKKGVSSVRLNPLETPLGSLQSQSSTNLSHKADIGFAVGNAKPRFDDIHYVSNLQHRAANMSRAPRSKDSPVKEGGPSKDNFSKRIEAVQLQALQESEVLASVTNSVACQYHALEEVASTILSHRKELSAKVSEINQAYVDLFETMLAEVMRIQRSKFKSQTSLIDDLKAAVDSAEGKLVLEKERGDKLTHEHRQLQADFQKLDIDHRATVHQLRALQKELECQEEDRMRIEEDAKRASSRQLQAEYEATLENLQSAFQNKLVDEKARYDQEMYKLRCQVEERVRESHSLREELALRVQAFRTMEAELQESKFRRPLVESSTQTKSTEEGLWDQQNGWVLPISSTALARSRWRKCINLARCPACKGNPRYIAQAATLFKQAALGVAPTGLVDEEQLAEDSQRKWHLPDTFVAFLSSLPPAVQAWNPHSLLWTVRTSLLLLDYKQQVDAEDMALGYRLQSLPDFLVETFLRTVDTRAQAERNLYRFLCSLREHHQRCSLLQWLARCLHCSGALTKGEEKQLADLRARGEAALQRKRKAKLDSLAARDRARILQDASFARGGPEQDGRGGGGGGGGGGGEEGGGEGEDVVRAFHAESPLFERDFVVHADCLSKEVLCMCLFARRCLLAEPYTGVYVRGIREAKQALHTFRSFEESVWKLQRSVLPPGSAAVHLPAHGVFHVAGRGQLYLPLDRAVRVMRAFLVHCPSSDVLGVYRAMEAKTTFLFPTGELRMPDGMHSFVRSTLRVLVHAVSPTGEDLGSWEAVKDSAKKHRHLAPEVSDRQWEGVPDASPLRQDIYAKYSARAKAKAKAAPTRQLLDDKLLDDVDKYTLVIDADALLELVAEIYWRKFQGVDRQLVEIFEAGDVNKDNVLSFREFKHIVQNVNRTCSDRKVLRMFREALLQGEDKDTIGPQAFANICKEYDLINMLDWEELSKTSLSALCRPKGQTGQTGQTKGVSLGKGPAPPTQRRERRSKVLDVDESEEDEEEDEEREEEEEEEEGGPPPPVSSAQGEGRGRPLQTADAAVQTLATGTALDPGPGEAGRAPHAMGSPPPPRPAAGKVSGGRGGGGLAPPASVLEAGRGPSAGQEAASGEGPVLGLVGAVSARHQDSVMIHSLPIKHKPLPVNALKSREYSEQLQLALQQRRNQRMQA